MFELCLCSSLVYVSLCVLCNCLYVFAMFRNCWVYLLGVRLRMWCVCLYLLTCVFVLCVFCLCCICCCVLCVCVFCVCVLSFLCLCVYM